MGWDLIYSVAIPRFPVRATYLKLDRWYVYEDVVPVLQALSAQGWHHFMLSDHVPELRDIVCHVGLMPYFTHIFNSAEIGYEKPNTQAFQIVLEALPDLHEVWMVGDNMTADVAGALALGIPAILVRRYHPDAQFTQRHYRMYLVLMRC